MKLFKNLFKKLIRNQRGSVIVDVSFALIIIMGLFIGFIVYSNSVRTKVIMNYAAKEGARIYAITKDENEGIEGTKTFLNIGGVNPNSVSVESIKKDSGIRIESDLNIKNPFFYNGETLKITSEFIFFEEYDPDYYNKNDYDFYGTLSKPSRLKREYDNKSWKRE